MTDGETKALIEVFKGHDSLSPLVPCAECWFKVEVPAETDDDGTEWPSYWECHRESVKLFPVTAQKYDSQGVLQLMVELESHWPDAFEEGSCGQGVRRE